MFKIITLFLISSSVFGASLTIIGPCEETPLFKQEVLFQDTDTVGSLTIKTLELNKIPFQGTEVGINSIFKTPTGLDALEVISETEMMAYGWCYSINGLEPNVFPNEIPISQNSDKILWWYGYAHFKDGNWISQCEPSFKRKPSQFCK